MCNSVKKARVSRPESPEVAKSSRMWSFYHFCSEFTTFVTSARNEAQMPPCVEESGPVCPAERRNLGYSTLEKVTILAQSWYLSAFAQGLRTFWQKEQKW